MNFDMKRIGKHIASLRREHNMTQMQLADEVGVSFQAVSNWERGQSMPDISKLPQLAELFSVTIDELLGNSSPLVEKAVEGKLEEHLKILEENGIHITIREAAEIAPILPPQQMDKVIDQVMNQSELIETADNDSTDPDSQDETLDIEALLPFMSEEKVDHLLRKIAAKGEPLRAYLPFASEEAIGELALQLEAQGESIRHLAPFASGETVDRIAKERMEAGTSFKELLPFMTDEAIDELALQLEARGESILHLAPFASEETIDRIAKERMEAGTSFKELLPFMSEEMIDEIALQLEAQGESSRKLAPFLSKDALDKIVLLRLKDRRNVKELLPFVSEELLYKLADTLSE